MFDQFQFSFGNVPWGEWTPDIQAVSQIVTCLQASNDSHKFYVLRDIVQSVNWSRIETSGKVSSLYDICRRNSIASAAYDIGLCETSPAAVRPKIRQVFGGDGAV